MPKRPRKLMDNGSEQDARFEIEGPDEGECEWICSAGGREVWCQNPGPREAVAKAFVEWRGSTRYDEEK